MGDDVCIPCKIYINGQAVARAANLLYVLVGTDDRLSRATFNLLNAATALVGTMSDAMVNGTLKLHPFEWDGCEEAASVMAIVAARRGMATGDYDDAVAITVLNDLTDKMVQHLRNFVNGELR